MRARFWFATLGVILTIGGILFLAIGAGFKQNVTKVSLGTKSEIPPVQQMSLGIYDQPGNGTLRVAISGVLSPAKTLEYYEELLDYIGGKLGLQVTLVLKPTYAEVNDLVRGQRVDLAFVCSLAYVVGRNDSSMELLVAPQMYGQTVYYSYLIVPRESRVARLQDLKGAAFAFTDPLSNSGYLAPNYQLYLLGETMASFFSRYIFTYSHDNSITAVANKLLDAAAVDSLVYDQMVAKKPAQMSKTKIVERWGPFGMPPLVVNSGLYGQLKEQLRYLLLNLDKSDEGRTILSHLGIDRFVVVPDSDYDSIRQMKTKLGW